MLSHLKGLIVREVGVGSGCLVVEFPVFGHSDWRPGFLVEVSEVHVEACAFFHDLNLVILSRNAWRRIDEVIRLFRVVQVLDGVA